MSCVIAGYCGVVDPPAVESPTDTGLFISGEDVDASVIESGTGTCPSVADKGCADVDASVVESGTGTCPSVADRGCADVDASVVESGTGTCPSVADKGCADVDASVVESCTGTCPSVADNWDGGADSLDGAEPCKGADPSNESCGGDPSDDDEYCKGVVPPGGVPRRLSDPVVTTRGTTGAAYARLRIERRRRI
jgi:hypothetical protein